MSLVTLDPRVTSCSPFLGYSQQKYPTLLSAPRMEPQDANSSQGESLVPPFTCGSVSLLSLSPRDTWIQNPLHDVARNICLALGEVDAVGDGPAAADQGGGAQAPGAVRHR